MLTERKDVEGVIQSLTSQQGSFFSLDYLLNSCQDTLYQVKCEDSWLQNLQKWHANTVNCVHCITELMWINTQNNIPESAFLVSCWAASHCQQLLCRLTLLILLNKKRVNRLTTENLCDRLHSHSINMLNMVTFRELNVMNESVLHLLNWSSYFLSHSSVLPHNVLWTCSDRSSVASDSCPQSYKALSRFLSKQTRKQQIFYAM